MLKNQKGISLVIIVVIIAAIIGAAGAIFFITRDDKDASSSEKQTTEEQGEITNNQNVSVNENAIVDGNTTQEGTISDENTVVENNTQVVPEVGSIISKETSYVGKYADTNADGTVDGIIYADLLHEQKYDRWCVRGAMGVTMDNGKGGYTIPKIDSAKDYYISNGAYAGPFGTAEVVSPSANSTGNERFYIMGLTDIAVKSDESGCNWYANAREKMNDYATKTSQDFGTGKANTATMIAAWNNAEYGAQSDNDIWGLIQNEVNDGWFVPSRAEWSAFAQEISTNIADYNNAGFSSDYWSSSQASNMKAYYCDFQSISIAEWFVDGTAVHRIRLSKTF